MSEWTLEFGGDDPARVGELVSGLVDGHMSRKMSANQRAAAAWFKANGDREREHTMGVFLKKAKVAGAAPVLGVYVDSHIMATDFGVNKDIYLARLANIGFAVSGIDFIPSREGYKTRRTRARKATQAGPQMLPDLSGEELREVDQLVSQLPEHLQASASKAMKLSKQKQKLQNTQNDKRR